MLPKLEREPFTYSIAGKCVSHSATVNRHNGSQTSRFKNKLFIADLIHIVAAIVFGIL